MNRHGLIWLIALLATHISVTSHAEDIDFSLGTGYPYLVIPEVSYSASGGQQRLYANYKLGLDDGFAIGFEHGLDSANQHAIGLLVGAIGAQDDKRPCPNNDDENGIAEGLASVIACSIVEIFDHETTNGIGLSYSYNHHGLNNSGFRIRFEAGYGEGVDSKEKRFDGAVVLSYQF
ncbi:hypothetical protein [Thalassotalea euphylliae]|uniref:Outer membrane protein beta-barrel domain-containing protein n=1 Tax=Thalassotalea euphylliae TaxID=1655234 RepID=A0A3E0U591_9GAMM|nr:hypothetical protein [Thalassotalea euphylliae]REL32171.1 hypothetical protein DXX94_16405 [Thalassotalea euphylliae]